MRSKFKWILTLLLAFSLQLSFAQEKTVTGVVSDATGPIPGANVVIKGTSRGVQTDMDGRYSISAKQGDVLVFSFVGMEDYQATVGASNTINATLQEGLQITEVVVGAMGIKRVKDATTSAQQTVKGSEINSAATPNAVVGLVGKVSGLQIMQTNSAVNATPRIVLRGSRSMTGDNTALIVIDNVISTAAILAALPPEMIESTNVLKGPQGAALYGSQGVNGVLIVTTKKGNKGGKVTVDISSSVDFEDVGWLPQRQRRYGQGWSGTHVTYENGAWGAEFDGVVRPVGLAQEDGTYIMAPYSSIKDNIKDFFQTGTIYQNTVSISAGDENGYVGVTAGRLDREFVVADDISKRTTVNFRAGKKMGNWDVSGVATYQTTSLQTTNSALYTELLQAATNIPIDRFARPYNQYHWTSYYNSPFWSRENIRNNSKQDLFTGQLALSYKINDNIDVSYTGGIRINATNYLNWTNEYIDTLQVGGGDHTTLSALTTGNANSRTYYGDLMVNFNYNLTDKIGLKANIGNNIQDVYVQSTDMGGSGLTIPGYYNISNVTGIPTVANSYTRQRRAAIFANADLSYDDFLFLNLTARNEWNSVLATDRNDFFYPSAGISFVPTKAFSSLENGKVVNYAKISANFVRNGLTAVGVNNVYPIYQQGAGFPFGTLNSFEPDFTITDPLITPEFFTTYEVSANLGFFNNRITLDGSYYVTKGKDLNTNVSTSSASGITNSVINIGATTLKGFEIDLGFTPIDDKDLGLKWTNRVGFSHGKTVVDKVSDQTESVALANFVTSGGIGIFAEEGEEFPLIKGIGYQRDSEGRVIINPATGMPERTNEYIKLGKSTPDYIVNYSTSIDYKGFTLSAVMDYRTGHEFWSGTKQWLSWSGHLYDSALTGRTGFIFPNSSIPDPNNPGQYIANNSVVTGGTTYGEYLQYFQDEYAETAENFVLDATAFKVRELSLSYTFSKDALGNSGLSALRVGVNARNPFMVLPTENRNYSDPEQSRTNGNDQGIAAVGQYPLVRTFGFVVNVTF